MVYSVFISHSEKDRWILKKIIKSLEAPDIGVKAVVYDDVEAIGEYPANKIKLWIKSSNIILVIFTQNGIESQWVNQEVGYGEAVIEGNPKFIPFVKDGLRVTGFTEGKGEIRIKLCLLDKFLYKLCEVFGNRYELPFKINGLELAIAKCAKFLKKRKEALESGTISNKESDALRDYYSPTRIEKGENHD